VAVLDNDGAAGEIQLARIGQGGSGVGDGAEDEQQDQRNDDAGDRQPVAPDLEPFKAVLEPASRFGG
jgi:hypothetical protein